MSIDRTKDGQWRGKVRIRIKGKPVERVVTAPTKEALKLAIEQKKQEMRQGPQKGSLTVSAIRTFGDVIKYYREHTEADLKKINCLFNKLDNDLGNTELSDLPLRFSEYWRTLRDERSYWTGEKLKDSSRNKLLGYSKIALNLCAKRGLINKNPLLGFKELPELERNRVLTADEERRILNVMERRNSWLYWPFYFSLKNPIRKSDLESLTRDNLDWFRPWIHFYASKTRKTKQRETCLPFLDERLKNYFKSLPTDCPYLFPRIDDKGQWHRLGDFKNHWHSILKEARVEGFVWHDLKHCSITWMLDNGYSFLDLHNLGIQYSEAMIKRYYKADAAKVLDKWENRNKQSTENQDFTVKAV